MRGLDRLFQKALIAQITPAFKKKHRKGICRYIYEMRPVFQDVILDSLDDKTSTAQRLAKSTGMKRTTVLRILDDLILLRWVVRRGSHYWISPRTARMPSMARHAYTDGIKLIADVNKELQAKKKTAN